MIALELFEIVLVVGIIWVGITQVVLPFCFQLPLFPMLHRRWRNVQHELNDVHDANTYHAWQSHVADLKETDDDHEPSPRPPLER